MQIKRSFMPADRYLFDFKKCTTDKGWAQVDTSQDASYYGTWANPFKLITLSYCEGDITECQAENEAEFCAELQKTKDWNNENGLRFLGIDPGFDPELKARFISLGLSELLH